MFLIESAVALPALLTQASSSLSPSLSNSPAHKYYLATSPVNGAVYLSDTSSRKVFKVKSLRVVKDVAKNLELVRSATLTNPRGIVWMLL